MKRTLFNAALALCLTGIVGAHAETKLSVSSTPQFGRDLLVDVAQGLGSEAKQAGLKAQTWQWNGVARIDSNDNPDVTTNAAGSTSKSFDIAPNSERKNSQSWIAVNMDTGFEYRVEMPREFAHQMHRYAEMTGSNMGDPRFNNEVQKISEQLPQSKNWSNGVDTRTRRFDNTTFPFRAMGQMGGGDRSGCSGTLIAHNIVLTAAHCIYNRSNASFYSLGATRFRPGREGDCNDVSCQPYGEHNATWYFTPAEYRNDANPWPYDYGIMVLSTSPGNQTGWLGYVAIGDDTLEDFCADHLFGNGRCFNRGYPACGLSGAPEACEQGWAYQDVNNCEVGGFGSKAKDGWNARVRVNCDFSGGHSGGPLFTDIWASNKRVVFGVASTQDNNFEFPNVFRRISPDVLDAISYFKAAYP